MREFYARLPWVPLAEQFPRLNKHVLLRMAEWLKAPDLKSDVGASPPGVRIPPPPPPFLSGHVTNDETLDLTSPDHRRSERAITPA